VARSGCRVVVGSSPAYLGGMVPISAVVGLPGAGKTYMIVRAMLKIRRLQPDRAIVSNTPLYLGGPRVRVIESIEEAFSLRNCELVLDELHLWMDSREWQQHRGPYAQWVSQLRKRDVNVWYSTQAMRGVDVLIKDRTQRTYFVESWKGLGFFTVTAYFGTEPRARDRIYRSVYLANPLVWRYYDHQEEVRI